MWERFSFYLMLGILPLYLSDTAKGGMGLSDENAAIIMGSYMALVYFTPFIGGLIADRLLGCRKTIVIGGLLMMSGHIALAWPSEVGLFMGLAFLILGNGAFKPNISTLLGNLYPPGSPLKDTGYNIFYVGVNLGAFICNFIAAIVRNYFDQHPLQITSFWVLKGWHAAFGTAAVGMFLGLTLFLSNFRRLARADSDPRSAAGPRASLMPLWTRCLLPAAFLGALGWLACDPAVIEWISVKALGLSVPLYEPPFNAPLGAFLGACISVILFYLNIWRNVPDAGDRGRVAGLLVVFCVSVVFWITYGLNTTTLNVWTRDSTDRQPNAAVRLITDHIEDFAENAEAKYFVNAGPEVPRPAKSTFEVVSDDRYKELAKAKELEVVEDKKVFVTQKGFDAVYAGATQETPLLGEGKHLRLVNTELYQSINPFFIITLTPLVVSLWRYLRGLGKEPSTSAKIGLGLLVTAGSPLVMLLATLVSNDGAIKANSWWLFATYAMVATGELCLSPMGLSLVSKMAPADLRAFMMGGWFLSTSIGLKLSGIFGETYQKMNHLHFWGLLIAINLLSAGFIFVLLPWLNRQMADRNS
jgi:POT family proton-dependent oligopeptide transporter